METCNWCNEKESTQTIKMSKKDGILCLCEECYKDFEEMVVAAIEEFTVDFIDKTVYRDGEYSCYCPECDKAMSYKDNYCGKCGTRLEFEKMNIIAKETTLTTYSFGEKENEN